MTTENTKYKKANRRKQQTEENSIVAGNVQVHSLELEKAVLGAIMLERGAIDVVADILKPETFYSTAHQIIYMAMQRLSNKGQIIDLLTVVQEIIQSGEIASVGGPYYVTKLTNEVVSTANLETHSLKIRELYMQRELGRIGGELFSESLKDTTDVFELMDRADKAITDITIGNLKRPYIHVSTAVVKVISDLAEINVDSNGVTGIPSGFSSVDKVMHGWQASDLVILAARPGVGKTAFALNVARNAALSQVKPTPVAFFSLEMSSKQLVERLMSAETEIWLEKFKTGRLTEAENNIIFVKTSTVFQNMPLYIDDTAAINLFELRAKARLLVRKHNVGLIIIDYLQLMSGDRKSGNREQEISTISRGLKQLAKELNIPIIALSQLSRDVEKRGGGIKMPQLSDLRESGAIEQDADSVLFIYRPEYYDVTANEMGESTQGETHLRIAKNRHGTLETIKLKAELHIQKFKEWDGYQETTSQLRNSGSTWRPVSEVLKEEEGF